MNTLCYFLHKISCIKDCKESPVITTQNDKYAQCTHRKIKNTFHVDGNNFETTSPKYFFLNKGATNPNE